MPSELLTDAEIDAFVEWSQREPVMARLFTLKIICAQAKRANAVVDWPEDLNATALAAGIKTIDAYADYCMDDNIAHDDEEMLRQANNAMRAAHIAAQTPPGAERGKS